VPDFSFAAWPEARVERQRADRRRVCLIRMG